VLFHPIRSDRSSNRLLKGTPGGSELSGIITMESGVPLNVVLGGNRFLGFPPSFEHPKHVVEGSTLGPVLRPPVVLPLHTPHPHHGIDAGAATKYVAEGHIEFSIVQSRRGAMGKW
jgi:hypothetical protein